MRILDPSGDYGDAGPQEVPANLAVKGSLMSCGVHMLWNKHLHTPKEMVDRVLKARKYEVDTHFKEAFIIFSDINQSPSNLSAGQKLADYIRKEKLGNLWESSARRNPNSGNDIKVWVWEPPHEDLTERYMECAGKKIKRNTTGDYVEYV